MSGICKKAIWLVISVILGGAVWAPAQQGAAVNYGSFTVGGSRSSYYPVQFVSNIYGAAPGSTGVNTSDLVIFRNSTHENGSWYGTFNFVLSIHPTDWGHFNGEIEKLMYQTGSGSPYNDPVADVADGSLSSGGDDIIVWLKGGATYHWRNKETTASWSLVNANTAGVSITDSSGTVRNPITSQSALILNAKNRLYINSIGFEVAGNVKVDGSLLFADGTTQSTAWTGALCGGDYAESVGVSGERTQYEPGDVLVIDPANPENFLKSSSAYATTVAGIYSTKPGAIGRRSRDAEKVKSEIPMAMVGIVPTKVSAENGPIKVGDLLVTSSTPGYAMKGTDRALLVGAVVGKALGSLDSGSGVINVLVTLQ